MQLTVALASSLFDAQKKFVGPFEWRDVTRNGQEHHSLVCSIAIDGGIRQGVIFRIATYPNTLECYTFQLEYSDGETKIHTPFYRFDLNPLTPHTNKLYGSDEVNGLYFEAGVTHEHDFRDNLTSDGQLRSNTCAQVRAVIDPPKTFATALVRVCSRINVTNGGDVPLPPRQGSLF